MAPTSPPAARHPLVVVDDAAAYADLLNEVAGAGWRLVAPGQVQDAADCGEWIVTSESDVQGALLAAASGVGVIARVMTPTIHAAGSVWQGIVDDLVEDLGTLGPVLRPSSCDSVSLDRLTWQLAHDLARGLRLEVAATRAHMSARTANRRVQAAREALGADSRAALVRALRSPTRVPPAPATC